MPTLGYYSIRKEGSGPYFALTGRRERRLAVRMGAQNPVTGREQEIGAKLRVGLEDQRCGRNRRGDALAISRQELMAVDVG